MTNPSRQLTSITNERHGMATAIGGKRIINGPRTEAAANTVARLGINVAENPEMWFEVDIDDTGTLAWFATDELTDATVPDPEAF